MTDINKIIGELIRYSLEKNIIEKEDEAYATCSLMAVFGVDSYESAELPEKRELSEILSDALDYAFERGLMESDGVVSRDLFDTKIMGALTPRPSEVIRKFYSLYRQDPALATDYFYALAINTNYIRADRVSRDLKWRVPSEYGDIHISINLSKPEKDPKAIALAKSLPQTDFPRCALCHENEGFAGTLTKAARQTLRQIPFDMAGEKWFLQYSPYVYYNEHCIALSAEHKPMSINRESFAKLLGFVTEFPHYFIGSNADLPIVGGSILSHDHMQGGRYVFPMELAGEKKKISFRGFEDIQASIVKWPMSVIRLTGDDKDRMVELADKILRTFREYTDEDAEIFAYTDGVPHNTITPIARRRGESYELDLVLRNNLTTEEHPLGLYHPHAEHHNIKKENIGLIEVMGLAILPARLKDEMAALREDILAGREITGTHKEWFLAFRENYTFTEENTEDILKGEIGKTFVRVLRDAGIYKDTDDGLAKFEKFIDFVNKH
ncbi:MAG: UDP-glucose--hexose-1-phosphate uridylyltransferase [Clostridia bacterium]|nr:UDP-glucose--hexose-1-phosphate uridylyltransferase [Clostridia bacterium]